MLVLTRRMGESIMINDEIELKVLRIKGRQVHIGIDAPHSTSVHRREVWDRIRAEAEAGNLRGGSGRGHDAAGANGE